MSRIICPNCHSEVVLPEHSSLAIGMTIAEDTKGDYVLPMKQQRDELGRFTKSTTTNANEERNGGNMNNTNNNGGMSMNGMNGFDMETLAKMVAAQLSGQMVQPTQNEEVQDVKLNKDLTSVTDGEVDKNGWAKNSQFYGKEICGYAFNPYMIRRFLPSQFEDLMKRYDNVVYTGVVNEYSYQYSINYTLEEVRKLAMLHKRDWIAFVEREKIFDLTSCKAIFRQYFKDLIAQYERMEREFVRYAKVGKELRTGIKGYGYISLGVVDEKIENHKVVKYINKSDEYKRIINDWTDMIQKLTNYYPVRTYDELYKMMSAKPIIKVNDVPKSKVFIDCFIKAGAYYTLKQMLMFDNSVKFRGLYGREAVEELRKELFNPHIKGYMIYAMLKEVKGIC